MAGKRSATSELNHDNWDAEEEKEEAGSFAKASQDALKGRVIRKAKRKGAAATSGTGSVFASFAGFGAPPGGAAAPPPAFGSFGGGADKPAGGGMFDFLKKGTDSGKDKDKAPASSPDSPTVSFKFNAPSSAVPSAASTAVTPPSGGGGLLNFMSKPSPGSEAAKDKAGGEGSKAAAPIVSGGFGDFMKKQAATGQWACDVCMVSNPGDKDKCLSCETPKPGAAPKKPDAPAFSAPAGGGFGDFMKKQAASGKWSCEVCMVSNPGDKDSCLSCETPKPGAAPKKAAAAAAPSFSMPAGGGFKFGSTPAATTDASAPASGFKFGSSAAAKETTDSGGGGGFKFGSTAPAPAAAGGFKFGATAKDDKEETKDDDDEETPAKKSNSGFTFGSTSSESKKPATPASSSFSFGGASKDSSDKKKDDVTSSPFGNTAASAIAHKNGLNKDSTAPSEDYFVHLQALNQQFSAWIKRHVDQDPLVLLTDVFNDYEKHLAEIDTKYKNKKSSNGSSSAASPAKKVAETAPAAAAASSFSFKATDTAAPSATSSFSFKPSTTESSEKKSAPAPAAGAFSFGSTAAKDTSTSDSSSKPAAGAGLFTFGSANAGSKPAAASGFTFGDSSSASKPSSGFSFGSGAAPAGGSGFSFSAPKPSEPAAAPAAAEGAGGEPSDEPPKVEVKTVVEEDSLHSVRCKLFYMSGKEFKEKGLGMLHLKDAGGDKTQLVVRAETNLGNILLNILVTAGMNMVQRKNNIQFVCVPNPAIKGVDGPVSMLVKVKDALLAEELVSKVKDIQEKMKK